MRLLGTRHETLPGFAGATGWLNSGPLTTEGLRGKVVLVDWGPPARGQSVPFGAEPYYFTFG
jgi:hypothetical protein